MTARELCDVCTDGYHEACDGAVWSEYINFPAPCECGHPTHKDTP